MGARLCPRGTGEGMKDFMSNVDIAPFYGSCSECGQLVSPNQGHVCLDTSNCKCGHSPCMCSDSDLLSPPTTPDTRIAVALERIAAALEKQVILADFQGGM